MLWIWLLSHSHARLIYPRQNVKCNLVSQHVKMKLEEGKQMQCCIHSSFLWVRTFTEHINTMMSRPELMLSGMTDFTRSLLCSRCACNTMMDRYTRHMKLQGLIGWFQPWFYLCLLGHKTFTQRKIKERQTKEHAPRVPWDSGHRNV